MVSEQDKHVETGLTEEDRGQTRESSLLKMFMFVCLRAPNAALTAPQRFQGRRFGADLKKFFGFFFHLLAEFFSTHMFLLQAKCVVLVEPTSLKLRLEILA